MTSFSKCVFMFKPTDWPCSPQRHDAYHFSAIISRFSMRV